MKNILLIIIVIIQSLNLVTAQNAINQEDKEVFKRIFLESCISEAKTQKLDLNAKAFCNCSFEKLFSLLEESGAELTDEKALDQITKSKDYENAIFRCMSSNGGAGVNTSEDVIENEFVRICAKNMKKDKFMRKNTDVSEICKCTYSKIKDSQYTMDQLNNLPSDESSKFYSKISTDCINYYFESKGLILQ